MARGGEGNVGFRGPRRPRRRPVAADTHRTVYLPIVRDGLPEVLTLFDFPDPSLIIGERATTTVPAQSLYLMNNPFVIRQAEALADKLLAGDGDDAARLTRAYQICYSRPPSATELKSAQKFLADYGQETDAPRDLGGAVPGAVRQCGILSSLNTFLTWSGEGRDSVAP